MQTQAKTNLNKSNNVLISTASKIQMMLMHLGECLFLKLFSWALWRLITNTAIENFGLPIKYIKKIYKKKQTHIIGENFQAQHTLRMWLLPALIKHLHLTFFSSPQNQFLVYFCVQWKSSHSGAWTYYVEMHTDTLTQHSSFSCRWKFSQNKIIRC